MFCGIRSAQNLLDTYRSCKRCIADMFCRACMALPNLMSATPLLQRDWFSQSERSDCVVRPPMHKCACTVKCPMGIYTCTVRPQMDKYACMVMFPTDINACTARSTTDMYACTGTCPTDEYACNVRSPTVCMHRFPTDEYACNVRSPTVCMHRCASGGPHE